MINRRLRPLMVPGPWDFVGLLLAASGFLLVAGPAILTGLYSRALRELPPGSGRPLAAALWEILSFQWGLWLTYYGLVVVGAIGLLRLRRWKTVIYNVDPTDLETALTRCLTRLGLAWTRQGNRLYLGVLSGPAPGESAPAETGEKPCASTLPLFPAVTRSEPTVVDLQPFRAMCHVTLNWQKANSALREEIETELGKELTQVQTRDNPAAAWLLGVAGGLFALMFFSILILIVGNFLGARN
jgi:hypothetical protein